MTEHKDHGGTKEHKYSSVTGKDTIYIDVDDEITAIIDKLRGSPQKIVALVLPKRATVLQSVVNMKLLKRTADDANKQVVLITTEASLLPLAGSVGLYVAKTLQSKPEVPLAPAGGAVDTGEEEALLMEDEPDASDAPLDASKSVGELAVGKRPPTDVDDTIDLDNSTIPAGKGKSGKKAKKAAAAAGNSKLKVPNFNRFRTTLILGVVGIFVLIAAWILCFNVLPKATISVKTNATEVDSNITLTLDTAAKAVDEKSGTVPAQAQQTQKQAAQQVAATGQKDEGTKASGSVSMTAQECGTVSQAPDVPAGTGLSTNGQTFITQQVTSFSVKNIKNNCINFVANAPTPVIAQNNGAGGNVDASNFTVASRSDVTASSSSAMTGGTSNIVKVVTQADIDSAKQKIAAQDATAIKQALQAGLQRLDLFAIDSTFKAAEPVVTTSAKAGDKADAVSVNTTTTYSMFGIKKEDVQKLIAKAVEKEIDPDKQVILENDAAKATYAVQSQDAAKALIALHATSVAGPDLKVAELRKQVAGKKVKGAQAIIQNNPGVTDVTVKYSPFWVSSIPNNPSKVSIVIEKPTPRD